MTSLPPPPEDECDCGDDFSPPGGDFFQCDDGDDSDHLFGGNDGGDSDDLFGDDGDSDEDGDDGDSDEDESEHLQRKTSLEGIPAPRLHPPPPGVHHQLVKVLIF